MSTRWNASQRRHALVVVVGLGLAFVAAPGQAQEGATRLERTSPADRERARGLMDEGDAMMARGDARGALGAYSAADQIVGVPTTGIEVGRAQEALGQWVEARDTWVRVALYPKRAGEPRPFTEARTEAERLAVALGARIPTLVVQVERPWPRGLAVHLDGQLLAPDLLGVPLRVNPGRREVQVRAPECETVKTELELAEKTKRHLRISLKRKVPEILGHDEAEEAASDQPGSPAVMWSGFGVALAGAAVGTATGIWAFDRTAAASEQCSGSVCPPSAAADIEQAKTAGVASTVAFALGGIGLGIGIWQAVVLGQDKAGAETPPTAGRPAYALNSPLRVVSLAPAGAGARLALTWRFQ